VKALVTGGAGFIGSHLVDLLAADGHKVTVVDPADPADPFPKGVRHIPKRCQDLSPGTADKLRAAVVFHLAGPVGPVGVLSQAGRIAPEIIGMAEWLQLNFGNTPVVFVSTSEVYGEQPQPVSEERPLVLHSENGARAEYAAAKAAAEIMLRNSLWRVRIISPFNVAGPRQRPDGGFVLPRFIEQALVGAPITVYGNGAMVRAFTHVEDIARGIYLAGIQGANRGIYNLGNEANACDIYTLATEVVAATGSESVIEFVDPVTLHGPAFREAPDKVPLTARAYSELGWSPKYDRARVIADTIGWWVDGGGG
jgi:UDP-glucose 4-epimerase